MDNGQDERNEASRKFARYAYENYPDIREAVMKWVGRSVKEPSEQDALEYLEEMTVSCVIDRMLWTPKSSLEFLRECLEGGEPSER